MEQKVNKYKDITKTNVGHFSLSVKKLPKYEPKCLFLSSWNILIIH